MILITIDFPWVLIDVHEFGWILMDSCWIFDLLMGVFSWICGVILVDFDGLLMGCDGFCWRLIGLDRFSWMFIDFHATGNPSKSKSIEHP